MTIWTWRGYIGVKNVDTDNYYCDKYKEIQNTPKI